MSTQPLGGVELRNFDDTTKTRQRIYENVRSAFTSSYPLENSQYKLELADVDYDEPDAEDYEKQRKAIITGRTLGRSLAGTWRLIDKTNNTVVDQRRSRIASVPHMTNRGTFIHNGSEWTIASQMRLKPGVYTRRKENGELESHFNIMPGSGPSFRLFLEPTNGVFTVKVGQSEFPVYPLLKELGVQDRDLANSWGKDLLSANMSAAKDVHLKKAYEKFTSARLLKEIGEQVDDSKKREALIKSFTKMQLDPDVTGDTLGDRYTNVSPSVMVKATEKLLGILHEKVDTDDRDNIAYQTVMGPEDLFAERIKADAGAVGRKLLWQVTRKRSLDPILKHEPRTKQIQAALLRSGLGMPLEESNPLDIFNQLQRVSRMGVGGVPSTDSIPDESRAVQPSYLAFIDPIMTSESDKAGVDNRVSYNTMKGSDGKLYTQLRDNSGKTTFVSSQQAASSVIAFPGEIQKAISEKRPAIAMVRGRITYVDPSKVNYELPSHENMMSPLAHFVPFLSAIKGHRMNMVARMATQALAMKEGEAPWVQSRRTSDDPDDSFEKYLGGRTGVVKADVDGQVLKVSPNEIVVRTKDGNKKIPIYRDMPFNRRSFLTNVPVVKPGDYVKPGQLLARSNYTNDVGELAIGRNLRTGLLPYKGLTVEDAVVISESAAKKLTSEHLYQHDVDNEPGRTVSKSAFVSKFPGMFTAKTLSNFDDNGVIKPGTVVNKGDPLILSVTKRAPKGQGVLLRAAKDSWTNTSEMWDHDTEGVVTDVYSGPKGTNVVVRTFKPSQIGDKLTVRHGAKGVISAIISDDKMPRDEEGNPLEALMHPYGITSRANPSLMYEAALGKLAAKLGKAYKIPGFTDESIHNLVTTELKKHNLKVNEDLLDPEKNSKIPNVFVGNMHWLKLHHTSESKLGERGDEGGYTADMLPAKGGDNSSKRLGQLETMSLISAGATDILRDAKLYRGQKNDEFWRAFRMGFTPPTPQAPFVYKKFFDDLKGAGINVKKEGNYVHIMALTDKDIDRMSRGPVKSPEAIDFDKMEPIKGGLFDIGLTGGVGGTGWSHIELHEPLPNPVFEEPIRKVLGLTENKFRDILAGKESIGGRTGPQAIRSALQLMNVDREIDTWSGILKNGPKSKRDDAIKRLRTLAMFKKTGIKPEELLLNKIPVLPPQYRPMARTGKGLSLVHDANYLYKEVMLANDNLKDLKAELGEDNISDERLALYDSFKALTGLSDPLQPKLQEKKVKGILSHALGVGSSPKFSAFQKKIIGSATDLVGRAVITPNPSLNMDQVGIPEDSAWKLYRPFIIRNLVRRGYDALHAAKLVLNKDSKAREALEDEITSRPVIINRAPSLHRYNLTAAYPVLVKGSVLQLPPTILSGHGADFDGDALNFHVPVSDEAVSSAIRKMLPSKNLINVKQFDVHYGPIQEFLDGLYKASTEKRKNTPRVFATKEDAINAWRRGEITPDTVVKIVK